MLCIIAKKISILLVFVTKTNYIQSRSPKELNEIPKHSLIWDICNVN